MTAAKKIAVYTGCGVLLFLVAWTLDSWSVREQPYSKNDIWECGVRGPRGYTRGNHTLSDYAQHPGVGFIVRIQYQKSWSHRDEDRELLAAIKDCRGNFGDAYRANLLLDRDYEDLRRAEQIGGKRVPFHPDFVVIVVHNYGAKTKRDEQSQDLVGYLFLAPQLFDPAASPAQVQKGGFRDEKAVQYSEAEPWHLPHYKIIDHYRALHPSAAGPTNQSSAID